MDACVYVLEHEGKIIYVGHTKRPETRRRSHCREAAKWRHPEPVFRILRWVPAHEGAYAEWCEIIRQLDNGSPLRNAACANGQAPPAPLRGFRPSMQGAPMSLIRPRG